MKILGLIPARGGSKGVPRKNVKPLGGQPLIAYSIQSGLQAKGLSMVMVSTDDEEIAEVAKTHGAEVPFLRPPALAADKSPTLDAVVHCLETLAQQGHHFDAVCLLQPTTPFRTDGFVDDCIDHFINSGCDALVSVLEVPKTYNPHWTFEANEDDHLKIATGETEIITRRQELPPAYFRDGSIYLTKTKVILNMRSLYGRSLTYKVSDESRYVNIDTLADWEKAESLL